VLEASLADLKDQVMGFAVAARFGTRNPAHELAARDLIRRVTGRPVTCSHELSAQLNGPKRALTAVLNARLIGMIDRLVSACERHLAATGITAPLMVVRGDGALISAAMVRERPIETILSGPAASIVGARWLTGAADALVSDIGGTTTDVALLRDGLPEIDPEGARVGGFRTMVEAVAMRTTGLGGDSEVHLQTTGLTGGLRLGPRRLIPVSLLAVDHPEMVHAALDRALSTEAVGEFDGRFVVPMQGQTGGLSAREATVLTRIAKPMPVAAALTSRLEVAALERLVARGPRPGEWLPRWNFVFAAPESGEIEQAAAGPSLMAHVLAAIDRRMTNASDRAIALALAEALEPSGWLGQTVNSIAAHLNVRPREVEAVLKRLQEFDPVGLFARDLAECLKLQAQEEGVYDAVMVTVLQNLDLLAKGDLARLATLAKVTPGEIALRFKLIRAMNPKPGAEFDALSVPRPREPDLLARRGPNADWEITLNRSSLPSLRLVDPGAGGAAALAAAKSVARMVEARNTTLLRVGRDILQRQIRALNNGPGALIPMTMAEVAEALALHESTISRVVAGTSVDTPRGVWWLRALFSRGLGEGQVAGAALREQLSRLVAEEDKAAPLSDEALAAELSQGGAALARRTVAKYRATLRIPPAHRRRQR
jgi:RNA polymerase sigma-54 factor